MKPYFQSSIHTQLSGKFTTEDQGIFNLKRHLIDSGIRVDYPKGDNIVAVHKGLALSFDPHSTHESFFQVEVSFLRYMKTNPIHVVHNKFGDRLGYIGESVGIEMAYAITHNKPMILLYEPSLSESLPPLIKEVILNNVEKLFISRLDTYEHGDVLRFVKDCLCTSINYDIDIETEIVVYATLEKLLLSYK